VVWDRATGTAVHRAIVWQDRRTADICSQLKTEGHEPTIFGQDRPEHRSLFFGDKSRLDPPITCPARASARNAANCCSAPSIAICCGG